MKPIFRTAILGAAILAFNVSADDLGDSKQILCSTLNVNVCQYEGECVAVLNSDLNIPQFIEVDTKSGRLSTTAASGENRESEASHISHIDDQLLIHGYQMGRAFSLLIHKPSGEASFTSIADGNAVVVFSACTPRNN